MFGLAISGVGDLATWVSVVFTVIAGVSAAVGFGMLRQRERRQALTELHASLTSGETAHARNTIGSVLYAVDEADRPSRMESIEAYFALIWALQRARNVFRTYGIEWISLEASQRRLSTLVGSRREDARMALTWNLTEIAENVVQFHDQYSEDWAIEDDDAWADIGPTMNVERLRQEYARR